MKRISVLLIILVISFGVFTLWWRSSFQPVNPNDKNTKTFVIAPGEAIKNIGSKLKDEGFIKDANVFHLYVRLNNLEKTIQAGSFKISPSMTLTQIVEVFKSGSEDTWVTIPEGFRAAEIAEVLEKNFEGYDKSWAEKLENEEGYLFPDTYLIPKDADITTIISIFKNTFNKKIGSIGLSLNDPKLDEILTIASLIEREAITDEEKAMISSVIDNRLKEGMPLDIDATLQYVKGKDENGKWWTVPTVEDRKLSSPYNTYQNPGLPPGPIANPGLEAIKAAMDPLESDYYFYIHDTDGKIHFAKTLSEHNRNVEKYLR